MTEPKSPLESEHEEADGPVPRDLQDDPAVMYPASHPDSGPDIQPGVGGYDDRDPATDVPRMPSQPETQDN